MGSTIAGTFGYMAPEQVQGGIEPRSDLYVLGMTLISLLTAHPPTDLPRKRLKPDYTGLVTVSASLRAFIDRLIEPVPDDRFASAEDAALALEDITVGRRLAHDDSNISALIAARDVQERKQEQLALQRKQDEHRQAIAKLSRRKDRVKVLEAGTSTRIMIAAQPVSDKLKEQFAWGIAFTWINPGIFIEVGLAALYWHVIGMPVGMAIPLAIASWTALLLAGN